MKPLINLFFFVLVLSIIPWEETYGQCTNEALDFDGVNDYVRAGNPSSFNEFTISAWFKSSSAYNNDGTEDRIFSFYDPRIEVGLEDNNIAGEDGKLWMYDESSGFTLLFSTANLFDDTWHHVVLTKSGMLRSIYLDGTLIDTWMGPDASYGDGFFHVGTWKSGPGANTEFKGQIDEVAFFDRALTESEISSNYECKLSGLESNLIGFWSFENGVPGADNTAITTTPNLAPPSGGFGSNASILGFNLMGSSSNFICPAVEFLGGNCVLNCEAECDTSILNLSTGYDINGMQLPSNMHQSKWRVVSVPPTSGVTPGIFPYILNTPSAWSDIPGAKYISPLPIINSSFDNLSNGTSFDFESCFCVCTDGSSITIDLSAYADNALNVDLYDNSFDNNGNFILDLLDISAADGTDAFNGTTYDNTHVLTLDAGQYCIKAALQNDGSTYMGFSMNATVSGAGLIKSECCGTTNGLTGFVYDDKNCNGSYEMSIDGLISGAEITVCDDMGVDIETVITDNYGLYTFSDLGPGDFTVKYTSQPNYELVETPSFPVTLEDGQVIGSLNFGLNYTGPITLEPFNSTCISTGNNFTFEWCGQSCECQVEILGRPCDSMDDYELIASIPNSRRYNWSVPNSFVGDYEFILRDCEGNEYPFSSCLTVVDYELNIQISKVDCGYYDFSAVLNGAPTPINSYNWSFGPYFTSMSSQPTQGFPNAGTYRICLTITLADGCTISKCLDLDVTEGYEDDCSFCPPEIKAEVEQGDLYIHDNCYGLIIQSPSGACYRIKVQDDGTLVTEPIDCPN